MISSSSFHQRTTSYNFGQDWQARPSCWCLYKVSSKCCSLSIFLLLLLCKKKETNRNNHGRIPASSSPLLLLLLIELICSITRMHLCVKWNFPSLTSFFAFAPCRLHQLSSSLPRTILSYGSLIFLILVPYLHFHRDIWMSEWHLPAMGVGLSRIRLCFSHFDLQLLSSVYLQHLRMEERA